MPQAALDYLAQHKDDAVDRLKQFLAIPSVSTDPAFKPHIETAAQWVAATLRDCGLDVTVHPTNGHPVVLGRTPQDEQTPGATDLLFYGHYDVQPPDPLDKWTTPPFEPTLRDGTIVARGASDDKGQVMCFIEALRAYRRAGLKPACNVTVLIEGEEECGSNSLAPFLNAHRDELVPDVVLVSDTTMWDRDTLAITYALRGLLYFDIQLHNSNRDLHSGMFGGTLANPATMLTRVLGRLFDDRHRVTIPGFYDDVIDMTEAEKKQLATLGFDEFAHLLSPIGVDTPYGEAGYTTLERRWARPACDVNGLYGGYGGAGAKTVIPSFAGAKVSFRLAPRQDPQKIAAAFEQWLHAHDVHGCRWKVTNFGGADPVITPTDSPHMAAARRALERASGKPAVLVRDGATIPVVAEFKKILAADTLLIGFGLMGDRIHAPNEKFDLHCFELGCRSHALLLMELGLAAGV